MCIWLVFIQYYHWWCTEPWTWNIYTELNKKRRPGSSVCIATGYGLGGPGIESRWRAIFSAPVQTVPVAHPTSCTIGNGSFPGVNSGKGVKLTPHPLLVPCLWKSRAIPLLPLCAVRAVQSLSTCTIVHFTFTFTILSKKLTFFFSSNANKIKSVYI
jgi:hypothetical protein